MSADDERITADQQELRDEQDQVEVLEQQEREEDQADLEVEALVPLFIAAHYTEVIGLVEAIFAGKQVDLDALGLSREERNALELLEEAVHGEDLKTQRMVYAEDRMAMLNHALAILQPTLAMGLSPELASLRAGYDQLVEDVTSLRDQLESLDSAQEEIFEQDRTKDEEAADAGDEDDKPDDDDPDAPSTLVGKAGDKPVEKPVTPSTLAGKPGDKPVEKPVVPPTVFGKPGDKPVEKPATSSTLAGKAGEPAVDKPVVPTTVWDGPDGTRR